MSDLIEAGSTITVEIFLNSELKEKRLETLSNAVIRALQGMEGDPTWIGTGVTPPQGGTTEKGTGFDNDEVWIIMGHIGGRAIPIRLYPSKELAVQRIGMHFEGDPPMTVKHCKLVELK